MKKNEESFMSRMVHSVTRFFKYLLEKLSKLFDRIVYNRTSSIIVSLIAAIVICFSVNFDSINYHFFNTENEVLNLTNVPVNATYNTDEYVVNGLPDSVAVTLTGSPADMTLYKNSYGEVEVNADLRHLSTGNNEVEFTASNIPTGLTATINPTSAKVTIYKKISRSYIITPEFLLGSGQSDGDFSIGSMSQNSIMIKADKAQLDSIRSVKALIDTSGHTASFDSKASLVAYDSKGDRVNVNIEPETITIHVKYKESKKEESQSKESNDSNQDDSSNDTAADSQNNNRN